MNKKEIKTYRRKYYQKNKEKMKLNSKKYYQKNKKEILKNSKEKYGKWYEKNKEKKIKKTKEHQKKNNYISEKTLKQRKVRNIKRKTRALYPLKDKKCVYCNEKATEHHHSTKPITIDDFEYVCHKCHIKANRCLKGGIKKI